MITKKQINLIAEELYYAEKEGFTGKLVFDGNDKIERVNNNTYFVGTQLTHILFPCIIHDEEMTFDDYVDVVYHHLDSQNIKYEIL